MNHQPLIRFASHVSALISHPLTFVVVMLVMGAWLVAWSASGFPDHWRKVQGVVTSAITFTLLFILNHNQRRDRIVTHIKIDELIRASEGAHNAILDLEKLTEHDIERIQSGYAEIAAAAREALRGGRTADATAVVEVRTIPGWCDVSAVLTDPARLAAVHRLGLDTPTAHRGAGDACFDALTRLAARQLDVPVVLLSVVTERKQVFASAVGLSPENEAVRETPVHESFCQYVVGTGRPFVVNDSSRNPLVCDNPAVRNLRIAAYCGVPIRLASGPVVGSLCAIDTRPRTWTHGDENLLEGLAEVVAAGMDKA